MAAIFERCWVRVGRHLGKPLGRLGRWLFTLCLVYKETHSNHSVCAKRNATLIGTLRCAVAAPCRDLPWPAVAGSRVASGTETCWRSCPSWQRLARGLA